MSDAVRCDDWNKPLIIDNKQDARRLLKALRKAERMSRGPRWYDRTVAWLTGRVGRN